jgi:hypothetical protein
VAGNPLRGEVEIKLDNGKSYTLRFNNGSIRRMEQMLGGGSVFGHLGGKTEMEIGSIILSVTFCHAGIFCGMVERGYKKVTQQLVSDLMSPRSADLLGYGKAIMKGIMAWQANELEEQVGEKKTSKEGEIEDPDDLEKKAPSPSSTSTDIPSGGSSSSGPSTPESTPSVSGS